eukprot:TRINITY_DN20131_c0_g1_i1.p1 TRINITY_DN20131_c0_g1~~TRINITY_DN20131_c0_g1_i1.p1  ORF type:complete len:564 (+),score=87.12 TRINITY_DN20131_c0_g1_i1:96-1694(+)
MPRSTTVAPIFVRASGRQQNRGGIFGRGWQALVVTLLQASRVLGGSLYPRSSEPISGKVFEFDPSNFDKVLSDKDLWVVVYYADWCPHCINFVPTWTAVANRFGADTRVHFGALNCAAHTKFCGGLGIEAYPTLRAYHNPDGADKASETREGAQVRLMTTLDDITTYVRQKFASAGLEVATTAADAASFKPPFVSLSGSSWEASPEDRLHDAEIAILVSFRQGLFLKADNVGGQSILRGVILADMFQWLDFLSTTLPSATARANLHAIRERTDAIVSESGFLEREEWYDLLDHLQLDQVPSVAGRVPEKYWRVCGGYTCGLWTLFHLLTVAQVQKASDEVFLSAEATSTKNTNVLPRIRNFVADFFGCADCVRHFLQLYDSCALGRCAVSATAAMPADHASVDAGDTDGDGSASVLWLWRAHNNVTARIASSSGNTAAGQTEEWPSSRDCQRCRLPSGAWDEAEVLVHLKREYWPRGDVGYTANKLFQRLFARDFESATFPSMLVVACIIIVLFFRRAVLCRTTTRVVKAQE